jgi:hypothetical protein
VKQAGVQEVISEIMGHANDSMKMNRYGKRYQPKVLSEAMVDLEYGIEISHVNVVQVIPVDIWVGFWYEWTPNGAHKT